MQCNKNVSVNTIFEQTQLHSNISIIFKAVNMFQYIFRCQLGNECIISDNSSGKSSMKIGLSVNRYV